jgi:hypothetical protein
MSTDQAAPGPAALHPATAPPATAPPAVHQPADPGPAWLRARAAYAWNNSPRRTLRWARRRWDSRHSTAELVTSTARSGEITIGYAGLPVGFANILQLLEQRRAPLAGEVAERHRGTAAWADLRAGRWPDCDLVVVGAEDRQARALPAGRSVLAPFRVHLVVDVGDGPDAVRQRISKRERWEFQRNHRRHGWTLVPDSSPASFDFFYHRMHRPTMEHRHGERGRTEDPAVAYQGILRHGELYFVQQDGVRVAGALCHLSPDGRTLTTRLLGVLDGDQRHYDSGAFKAVYHLLLDHAARTGRRQVDFFGTEAFLSKGIFQWKRKFAPRVVLPRNHFATKRVYLHIRRDTPPVRDFLVANPLLAMDPAGLRAVYFADAERPARTDISSKCPGLPPPRVVDLDNLLGGG